MDTYTSLLLGKNRKQKTQSKIEKQPKLQNNFKAISTVILL